MTIEKSDMTVWAFGLIDLKKKQIFNFHYANNFVARQHYKTKRNN